MEKYYVPLLFGAVLILALSMKLFVKPATVQVNNKQTQQTNSAFPNKDESTEWNDCLKSSKSTIEVGPPQTCLTASGKKLTNPTYKLNPNLDYERDGWISYSSPNLGFSLKYPPNRGLKVSENANSVFFMATQSDYGFIVTKYESAKETTTGEWITENFDRLYADTRINGKKLTKTDLKIENPEGPYSEITVSDLPTYGLITEQFGGKRIYKLQGTWESDVKKRVINSFAILAQ